MIRLTILIIFLIIYFMISLPIQLAEWIIQHFNMNFRNKSSLAFVQFGLKCVCIISGVKVEVKGYDNIPEDTAVLFVSNHRSVYDIITTYPLMKHPTGYIAKKEIKKIPFLSWWMYFVNCIFLDRQNPREGLKSIIEASDMIKNGISVFVFPEGTRTKDGALHEFKEGSLKIATKAKCPVIPVGICGSENVFEKQFPRIKSSKVTISFGRPIDTADMSREELKTLSHTVHEEVSKLI